ncbi:hypothetical protein PR048_022572 [Dryococelus australis]|uniref:C2H2-type domain-containing protein n=1 Tax=Dryococelus australis TaxID=614101 RepID=A0ABQ9H1F3_9NEOP|nr:hypothetical protein PR048_022572 [Dryococelus australis]
MSSVTDDDDEINHERSAFKKQNPHWPSEMEWQLHTRITANKERKLPDMCTHVLCVQRNYETCICWRDEESLLTEAAKITPPSLTAIMDSSGQNPRPFFSHKPSSHHAGGNVQRRGVGATPECKGGVNGRSPRKPVGTSSIVCTIPTCENPGAATTGNRTQFAMMEHESCSRYARKVPYSVTGGAIFILWRCFHKVNAMRGDAHILGEFQGGYSKILLALGQFFLRYWSSAFVGRQCGGFWANDNYVTQLLNVSDSRVKNSILYAPNTSLSIAIDCCLLEKTFTYLTGPLRIRKHQHGSYVIRVQTVAERFFWSPPTKANRVQSPAVSLSDFRNWESCCTMPLVSREFSCGSYFSLRRCIVALLHSHLISPSSALETSMLIKNLHSPLQSHTGQQCYESSSTNHLIPYSSSTSREYSLTCNSQSDTRAVYTFSRSQRETNFAGFTKEMFGEELIIAYSGLAHATPSGDCTAANSRIYRNSNKNINSILFFGHSFVSVTSSRCYTSSFTYKNLFHFCMVKRSTSTRCGRDKFLRDCDTAWRTIEHSSSRPGTLVYEHVYGRIPPQDIQPCPGQRPPPPSVSCNECPPPTRPLVARPNNSFIPRASGSKLRTLPTAPNKTVISPTPSSPTAVIVLSLPPTLFFARVAGHTLTSSRNKNMARGGCNPREATSELGKPCNTSNTKHIFRGSVFFAKKINRGDIHFKGTTVCGTDCSTVCGAYCGADCGAYCGADCDACGSDCEGPVWQESVVCVKCDYDFKLSEELHYGNWHMQFMQGDTLKEHTEICKDLSYESQLVMSLIPSAASMALNTDDDSAATPTNKSSHGTENETGGEDDHEDSIDDNDYENSIDEVSDENDDDSLDVSTYPTNEFPSTSYVKKAEGVNNVRCIFLKDPTVLVDRLKYLIDFQKRWNFSHIVEISSIIDELKDRAAKPQLMEYPRVDWKARPFVSRHAPHVNGDSPTREFEVCPCDEANCNQQHYIVFRGGLPTGLVPGSEDKFEVSFLSPSLKQHLLRCSAGMEERGKWETPKENPMTTGIVQYDINIGLRKSGSEPTALLKLYLEAIPLSPVNEAELNLRNYIKATTFRIRGLIQDSLSHNFLYRTHSDNVRIWSQCKTRVANASDLRYALHMDKMLPPNIAEARVINAILT